MAKPSLDLRISPTSVWGSDGKGGGSVPRQARLTVQVQRHSTSLCISKAFVLVSTKGPRYGKIRTSNIFESLEELWCLQFVHDQQPRNRLHIRHLKVLHVERQQTHWNPFRIIHPPQETLQGIERLVPSDRQLSLFAEVRCTTPTLETFA